MGGNSQHGAIRVRFLEFYHSIARQFLDLCDRLRLAMEELYGSVAHGLDHIPPQVQLKHLLHCWKVAVKFESELATTR